jgi:hypothetical protein
MVTAYSRTVAYDTELTAKLNVWLQTNPVEQAALGNSFWQKILRTNRHSLTPANYYDVPVSFVEDPIGGFYKGASTTATTGSDDVTMATYRHALRAEPVKLWRSEKKQTAKGNFDILKHKMRQARLRLNYGMQADIMAATKKTNGIETIQLAIPEDGGSGTAFGGLDGANDAGWLCNFEDMSAGLAATLADVDYMSQQCTKFGLTDWDYIVTTYAVERYFKAEARANASIDTGTAPAGTRIADTGWTGVTYEGKPVIPDRSCKGHATSFNDESIYFLNDNAIYLQVDPTDDMVMEGPFPLQAGKQHGDLWQLYWGGQLIVEERGALGVVFDVTGA